MRRVRHAIAVLLLWCALPGCGPAAPAPRSLSAAAQERLAQNRDPASWEDLDAAQPGRRLRDPRTGIVFVRVPKGEFEMGSDAVAQEQPQHAVQISRDYLLAETELTIGQWQTYVREFGGDPAVPVPVQSDQHPMPLSCLDALAFAAVYGYRLPTEAEWERACSGGLPREKEPWQTEAGMREAAWFHRNSLGQSHPVGQKAKNAFGLYDMLGNLWEWCADDFDPVAYGKHRAPAVDPRAGSAGSHRVLRGGSWFSIPPASPRTRSVAAVEERNLFFGVRFAADAPVR